MQDSLDYSVGAKPLYAQLYDILLNKLEKGEYTEKDRFPTEAAFQNMFGVSRITARRALEDLAKNGYIKRQRGIGTQVIRNSLPPSIKISTSFLAKNSLIEDDKVERETVFIKRVIPSADVQDVLKIANNVPVFFIRRILKAGVHILQINDLYLSPLVQAIDEATFNRSFYLFLEKIGLNVDNYTDYISAVLPTESEAQLLKTTTLEPLLKRTRIGYHLDGSVIEYTTAKFISRHVEYKVEFK